MLTLQEYAKKNNIAYTTACKRVKTGKVLIKWGKRKIERWQKVRYVIGERKVKRD